MIKHSVSEGEMEFQPIDVDSGWQIGWQVMLCKSSVGEKNNPEMRHPVRQPFMWSIMSARVARR